MIIKNTHTHTQTSHVTILFIKKHEILLLMCESVPVCVSLVSDLALLVVQCLE